ncbi:EamA family transporter [Brumimicrobium oceani]|nr:DMT family transporter [Brumimicrobium oceani]
MTKKTGLLYVGFGSLSYGILATVVKYANGEGASTALLTFSQYLFATVFLTILAWRISKSEKVLSKYSMPSKVLKLKIMLFGTTLGFSSCFYYLTIQYVPVSVGIILLMQSIWMGVLVDLISTRGANVRLKILGALTAITGTLLAANVFESSISPHPLGLVFGLLAALSFTSFMYFSNSLGHQTHVIIKSKYLVYGGFIVVLIFWNISIFESFDFSDLLKYGLFLAIFGSMIPPIFFAQGMPAIGTGLGSIVSSIEIPFSVLSAAVILGEDVSSIQWLGIVVILCAVVLINFKKI